MINNGKLFAGLDRIDWAGMSHAYGSAVEVPELLRGLVAEDPARRENALDALYGAVHHQGDVYDSTVAASPFLLDAVGRPDLPGRGGIVELLASIGGAFDDEADDAEDDDFENHDFEDDALGDDEDDDDEDGDHYRRARALVAAAYPLLLGLHPAASGPLAVETPAATS